MCGCESTWACPVHADPWWSDPHFQDWAELQQERRDAEISVPDFIREGGGVK